MNREIKFRAYGKSGQMIPWEELCGLHAGTIFQNVEGYHVMQFTGLKDKNGKEIYEGDILMMLRGITRTGPRALWKNGKYLKVVSWSSQRNCVGWNIRIDQSKWTVIGNIYENPELLKSL